MFGTNLDSQGMVDRNAKVRIGRCIFPFKYNGKVHSECIVTPKGRICATSTSNQGILRTYGYCRNTKKSTKKKTLKKSRLRKLKSKSPKRMEVEKTTKKMTRLNEKLIKLLAELEDLMYRKGEHMRARAYSKAQETIMLQHYDITNVDQLKGKRGIGKTILAKFKEFVETGTLKTLEKAKNNPIYLFAKIFGIGPKKAKALVEKDGIKTLAELKAKENEVLNNVQRKGLKYFEDIEKRIPRAEIRVYERLFKKAFDKLKGSESTFEIVGSYRRGARSSGDIDVIITDTAKNKKIFHEFIEALVADGIIIEILSKGKIKSMVLGKLKGNPARRIDFMFTPKNEYAFAVLYFTGSKPFNVTMREYAKTKGYSLNEHKFTTLKDKKPVTLSFPDEQSIFDFLQLEYRSPEERKDGRAVFIKPEQVMIKPAEKIKVKSPKKAKTLKKKKKTGAVWLLKKFKKQGITLLRFLSEAELAEMIRVANEQYYNKQAILTDSQYDIVKEFVEAKFPKNKVLEEVGAPIVATRKKVKLPVHLPSMDKIKPDTKKLGKWVEKYSGPYVLSAKLDGASGLYVTAEGKAAALYTRGNGKVGQDISQLVPYLNLPNIPNIMVRGEIIMSKKTFNKKYSKEYANPRSAVVGILPPTRPDTAKYRDLDYVAYEVIKPHLKPSKQMSFLEQRGFITVKHEEVKELSNELLSKVLIAWRKDYNYQIDGVIVADDKVYLRTKKNPKHAFAFKMVLSDQMAEAKVVDVLWTPSKDGLLKPRIQIEPIHLGGTRIEFATAFNADFVQKNKIGIGAIVRMVRAGDVIPHIHAVIEQAAEAKMPAVPYHWNDTHVDIRLDNAEDNLIVQEKTIARFFTALDVDGLSRGNVRRLMRAGFDTTEKIIKMGEEDFLKADGFKKRMAAKVYNSIHKTLAEADIVRLMAATNFFGRGMGKRRLRAILDVYPKILTSTESKAEIEGKIAGIKGFGEKTSKDFVDHLTKFKKFLKDIGLESKLQIVKKKKTDTSHVLYGKKILMTGFRDGELQKEIEKATGTSLSSAVSKNTFVVLVKDPLVEHSGKAERARELGIPLMTPEGFRKKYLK